MSILRSTTNRTVMVAKLPREVNSDKIFFREMSRLFKGVDEVNLVMDEHNQHQSRCFGFIRFDTHENASEAFQRMKQGKIILYDTRGHAWVTQVEWAKTPLTKKKNRTRKMDDNTRVTSKAAYTAADTDDMPDFGYKYAGPVKRPSLMSDDDSKGDDSPNANFIRSIDTPRTVGSELNGPVDISDLLAAFCRVLSMDPDMPGNMDLVDGIGHV